MDESVVRGRFVNAHKQPIEGKIRFVPSRVWVEEDGVAYPTMAPDVPLVDGRFIVALTRTDQHGLPWHYTVECPLGTWTIRVEDEGPLLLKDLLPKRIA